MYSIIFWRRDRLSPIHLLNLIKQDLTDRWRQENQDWWMSITIAINRITNSLFFTKWSIQYKGNTTYYTLPLLKNKKDIENKYFLLFNIASTSIIFTNKILIFLLWRTHIPKTIIVAKILHESSFINWCS